MRSLLLCMLGQADKVEAFKKTLNKDYALHAKFNMSKSYMYMYMYIYVCTCTCTCIAGNIGGENFKCIAEFFGDFNLWLCAIEHVDNG